jgi:hypothetical protein
MNRKMEDDERNNVMTVCHGSENECQCVHYQSVRYVKLCHALGVVAVGKLDKVY